MTHRPLSNPLTESQTADARKRGMYFLCRGIKAHHDVDGVVVIPAGTWILIIGRRKPQRKEEYKAEKMVVASPDSVNLSRGISGMSVIKSSPHKPFRFLVVPRGRELEYYELAKCPRR